MTNRVGNKYRNHIWKVILPGRPGFIAFTETQCAWTLFTDYSTSSAWSSCGFLHSVVVKFTDASEERIASIFRVAKLVQMGAEEM
jgi:hypothetical protein